jgi:hypothetical protein
MGCMYNDELLIYLKECGYVKVKRMQIYQDVTIMFNSNKSSLGCAHICANDWWRGDPTIRWMTDEVGKAERYVIHISSVGI